jgi:hypothetical protein
MVEEHMVIWLTNGEKPDVTVTAGRAYDQSNQSPVRLALTTGEAHDNRLVLTLLFVRSEIGSHMPYSMTSSALARRVGGTVMPRALAVLRLIINSSWLTAAQADWPVSRP